MQVTEVLNRTIGFFKKKGFESARLESELLISSALGWQRIDLYSKFEYPLSVEQMNACRELVKRRTDGEPIAYILGEKGFYQDDFKVGPGVLIPRPETETIVDEVEKLRNELEGEALIFDFGCGSGCLGLSLLRVLPGARLAGFDISETCVSYSKENAEALGLESSSQFFQNDVASLNLSDMALEAPDLIVANPPYIAKDDPEVAEDVKSFEPSEALFSEDDGLAHIKGWALKASELLKPGGFYFFEIGHRQGQVCKDLLEQDLGFSHIEVIKDLSGKDRVIRAQKELR